MVINIKYKQYKQKYLKKLIYGLMVIYIASYDKLLLDHRGEWEPLLGQY